MNTIGKREGRQRRVNDPVSARTLGDTGDGEGSPLQQPELLSTVRGCQKFKSACTAMGHIKRGRADAQKKAGEAGSKEAANEKTPWSIPSISLPKGGGAIRGLGEKFAANLVAGMESMNVFIFSSPSFSGSGAQLTLFAYAAASVAVGGAVIATLGLGSAVKHTPTLFFCSVVLSSWFGGLGPGIFAGLLSAIALDYYFIPPIYALGISLDEAPDMIVFVVSAVFASWLNRDQNRGKDSLRQAHDGPDAEIHERTAVSGRTEGEFEVRIARRRITEETQTQARAEVTPVADITTLGEIPASIAVESDERNDESDELAREFSSQTHVPQTEEGLLDSAGASLAHSPTLYPFEESVFVRQCDYWTVQYRGQTAHLKATRGLQYLACLLEQPGREFHVSELIVPFKEKPVVRGAGLVSGISREDQSQMRTARFQDAGPILDARAKAEYARRLAELREELEDAERLNDSEWAGRIRQERECIADQMAAAIGLGGRNRKAASEAERARTAVTKRIKDSIHKIAEAMPYLGRHLGTSVKTGYFCTYNPDANRPVKWKLDLNSKAFVKAIPSY